MIKTIIRAFYIGQIAGATMVTIWAASMAIRSIAEKFNPVGLICFTLMAIIAYRMLFTTSIKEYKEHYKNNKI